MLSGVLFVSPSLPDAAVIIESLGAVGIPARHAGTLSAARQVLEREVFGAILTEAWLPDGDWQDVIALVRSSGRNAPVVVADRLANARLWADVLDTGGYDLIATPYSPQEVQRILANAVRESSGLLKFPAASQQRQKLPIVSAAAG